MKSLTKLYFYTYYITSRSTCVPTSIKMDFFAIYSNVSLYIFITLYYHLLRLHVYIVQTAFYQINLVLSLSKLYIFTSKKRSKLANGARLSSFLIAMNIYRNKTVAIKYHHNIVRCLHIKTKTWTNKQSLSHPSVYLRSSHDTKMYLVAINTKEVVAFSLTAREVTAAS